ncbi:RNA polymerase sigma factor [Bacillus rubiinfantis]|uniref:RNA polymerase sigma factor n=1 Tax=Bacillus rubiinfantis TaxID=1499680 RepID=UPI0005A72211|nr:RNA polymerase sigma factor [Bacillus rubiinfantis]
MWNDNSEDQLIKFIQENKEDFYRLAYTYVRNSEDALDIVQESIRKALTAKQSLKKANSVKSWFYKIVVHTALDFLRKQKKVTIVDETNLDYFSKGKNDSYQNIDLKRSLEALPLKYSSVIVLKFFEDLTIDEVAEVLQEKPNTVKTRLYRALELLRIELEQD